MAFAESRIRQETIAAEDILHDMGEVQLSLLLIHYLLLLELIGAIHPEGSAILTSIK